jgi:hypothetical protein
VVSSDPSLTVALAGTPTSTGIDQDSTILAVRTGSNQNLFQQNFGDMHVPILEGRTYFVVAAGATNVLMYLDLPET